MSNIENRLTSDLLAEALALSRADPDADVRWQLIHELHRRGTEDIFLAAQDLSAQAVPAARYLAADILGQLGALEYRGTGQGRPFTEASMPILRRLLEDQDDRVVAAAIAAIGHHYRNAVIAELPSLREALYRRLSDADFDTRSEAIAGLAERKDPRVVPFIVAALTAETVGTKAVEAAGTIGSPDLLEPLLELRAWWDVDPTLLETAIRKCGGAER